MSDPLRTLPTRPEDLPPESEVVLTTWRGFHSGPPDRPSDGRILVIVGEEGAGDDATAEHLRALEHLVRHAERIQTTILDAIVAAYPATRARYEKAGLPMRPSVDRTSLRDLISLESVKLHHEHRDGVAYTGYSLSCAWDCEHGLGLMMHGDRVLKLGGADTAILGWIAERELPGATSVVRAPVGVKAAPKKAAPKKPAPKKLAAAKKKPAPKKPAPVKRKPAPKSAKPKRR